MKGTAETEVRFSRNVGDWVEAAFLGILQGESMAVVEQDKRDSQQGRKFSVQHQSRPQFPMPLVRTWGIGLGQNEGSLGTMGMQFFSSSLAQVEEPNTMEWIEECPPTQKHMSIWNI